MVSVIGDVARSPCESFLSSYGPSVCTKGGMSKALSAGLSLPGRSGVYEIFFTDAPTALDRIFKTGINAYDGVAGEFRRLLLAAIGTSVSPAVATREGVARCGPT